MLSRPIPLSPAAVRARMSFVLGTLGVGGVILFGAPYVRQLVEPSSASPLFELRSVTGVSVAAMLMGLPNTMAVWLGRRYETADPFASGGRMLGVLGLFMLCALSAVVAFESYERSMQLSWIIFAGLCLSVAIWGATKSRATLLEDITGAWFADVSGVLGALAARGLDSHAIEPMDEPFALDAAACVILDESAEFAVFADRQARNSWLRDKRRPGGGLAVGVNWGACTDTFDGALQIARALGAKAWRRI